MPPKQVAALHGGLVAGVLMRRVGFPWLPQVPPRRLVHVHVLVTTSQRPPATQRPRPNRRRALVTVSRSNSCPPLCKLYTSKIHIVSSRLLRSSAINQFLRAPLQWTPSLRLLALAALDRASSQQQQLQDPPFRHAPVAVAHRWIHGRYLAPRPGHSISSPNTSVERPSSITTA
ncbi:hypothetical protein J3E69DRAFT_354287 [Trichoderma sp. SZMC 28015]